MQPQKKSVDLPNGAKFEFYMTPLTLAQRAKAQRQAKTDDATDFALQLLAMKATDEYGEKLFQPGELVELQHDLPASVVDALMLQMLTDKEEEDEEEDTDMKSRRKATKS